MPKFSVNEEDDIWTIYHGLNVVGRALSKRDAMSFLEYLNGSFATNARQKLLDDVTDAIEGAFDEAEL